MLNQNVVVTKKIMQKSSGGQSAIASHDFTVVFNEERDQRESSESNARAAQAARDTLRKLQFSNIQSIANSTFDS